MLRVLMLTAIAAVLGGCGLAGTAASGAAEGAAQAQEAAQAKQTQDRVRQQLDAASQQAVERERAAEEAAK